jgi:murein DD-endopeptidase MepM/ murein hydrolase activator NlpD
MHTGIDYGGSFNVLAAADGIVHAVGANMNTRSGFGHWVRIDHGNRFYTFYAHGAHASRLKKGDRVKAGDLIFRSGSTGSSTNVHLHFEVRQGSFLQSSHKDPMIFLTGSRPDVATGGNPYKVSVAVNGRENRETWRAWQTALKARWGYRGIIDGIPGKMSWSAIQRSVSKHYKGPVDGVPGPMTYRGVQLRLQELGFYAGAIDGKWGKLTWSAIQRSLNEGKY